MHSLDLTVSFMTIIRQNKLQEAFIMMNQHLCLFLIGNQLDEKKQKDFYYRMCTALGYDPTKAVSLAALYSPYGLFDSIRISKEEYIAISKRLQPCKSCAALQKKALYKTFPLSDHACPLCIFSNTYRNAREKDEMYVIRWLMKPTSTYEYYQIDPSDAFTSVLRLADDYALGDFPVIPFNLYLYQFIENHSIDQMGQQAFFDQLLHYIITQLDTVFDLEKYRSVLQLYFNTILRIDEKTVTEDVYNLSANALRKPYTYTPPTLIVSPVSSGTPETIRKKPHKKIRKALPPKNQTSLFDLDQEPDFLIKDDVPQNSDFESVSDVSFDSSIDMFSFQNIDDGNSNSIATDSSDNATESNNLQSINSMSANNTNTETIEESLLDDSNVNDTSLTDSSSDTDICNDETTSFSDDSNMADSETALESSVDTPMMQDIPEVSNEQNNEVFQTDHSEPFFIADDDEDIGIPPIEDIQYLFSSNTDMYAVPEKKGEDVLPQENKDMESVKMITDNITKEESETDSEKEYEQPLLSENDKTPSHTSTFTHINPYSSVQHSDKETTIPSHSHYIVNSISDYYTYLSLPEQLEKKVHIVEKRNSFSFVTKLDQNLTLALEPVLYHDRSGFLIYLHIQDEYFFYDTDLFGNTMLSEYMKNKNSILLTRNSFFVMHLLHLTYENCSGLQDLDAMYWITHDETEPCLSHLLNTYCSKEESINPDFALSYYQQCFFPMRDHIKNDPDSMRKYNTILRLYSVLSSSVSNYDLFHTHNAFITQNGFLHFCFNFSWSDHFYIPGQVLRIEIPDIEQEKVFHPDSFLASLCMCFSSLHHTHQQHVHLLSITTKAVYVYYDGDFDAAMRFYDSIIVRFQKVYEHRFHKPLSSHTAYVLYK